MMGEPALRPSSLAGAAEGSQTDNATSEPANLWQSILNEALYDASKAGPEKHLLLLGSEQSGKSSLLSRLCNRDPAHRELARGLGLEYTHMDVAIADDGDDADTDTGRISTWLLGSEAGYMPLLRFAINRETYAAAIAALVIDMSRPWSLLDDLQAGLKALAQHIASLDIPVEVAEARKAAMVESWQHYEVPGPPASEAKGRATEVALPLEEGVLIHNLGLPLVVVCTKCDTMDALDGLNDEHFDFIQRRLRRLCLQYGAALVYTSSTADRNCGALRQYIGHQLYGTACTVAPSAVDRDTVLIPAGWDSAPKIDALVAGLRTLHPDDPWEAVIKPPGAQRRARQAEAAVAAEDEQAFLAGIAAALENGGSDPGAAPGPATPTPAPASGTAAAEREGGTSRAAPGAGAAAGTGKSDEAAMAFFNSLLQKSSTQRAKTGAAQVRTPPQAGRGPSPGGDVDVDRQ